MSESEGRPHHAAATSRRARRAREHLRRAGSLPARHRNRAAVVPR
ncbi:Hypothetical protein A7982_03691 [Minicystis rosea]|nr:Hypothetical protein A7982_03691 [Minicystis rosea]